MECREGSAAFCMCHYGKWYVVNFITFLTSLFLSLSSCSFIFIIGEIMWRVGKGVEHSIIFHLDLIALLLFCILKEKGRALQRMEVGSGAFTIISYHYNYFIF